MFEFLKLLALYQNIFKKKKKLTYFSVKKWLLEKFGI